MPTNPSYLTVDRHGTDYFRLVVPKPLRSAFGSQREIRRSLKTDSQRLALCRARQYAAIGVHGTAANGAGSIFTN